MYYKQDFPSLEDEGKALEEMSTYVTFDTTYHPGLTEEDLCHKLYDEEIDKRKTSEVELAPKNLLYDPESKVLCHNCGWHWREERYSSYTSRVKIHHTKTNTAIWNIGTKWMLRDEPNDYTLANDCDAMEFLRSQNTTVPVPEIHRLSDRTDRFQFTLMARAQGEPLCNVWDTYTKEERQSIAKQLMGYIRQWRQFTAPRPQKVNGEKLNDVLVGTCNGIRSRCKKIGYTTEEWLEDLSPELRKGLIVQDKKLEQEPERLDQLLQELKEQFPKGGPYVFTHGDLNSSNIIVSKGEITGIIDWECAGFYPWWAERRMTFVTQDPQSHELFGMIEDELWPDYDNETFLEKISYPVGRVREVYQACPRLHQRVENVWIRRPFCQCNPKLCQRIRQDHMGTAPTHKIAELDAELSVRHTAKKLRKHFPENMAIYEAKYGPWGSAEAIAKHKELSEM